MNIISKSHIHKIFWVVVFLPLWLTYFSIGTNVLCVSSITPMHFYWQQNMMIFSWQNSWIIYSAFATCINKYEHHIKIVYTQNILSHYSFSSFVANWFFNRNKCTMYPSIASMDFCWQQNMMIFSFNLQLKALKIFLKN